MSSTSNTEYDSFSSEDLDIEISNNKVAITEIFTFFSQYPYITTPVLFIEKVEQSKVLKSGDTTLAVALLSNYNDIKGCLEKRFKKTVNSLTENITGSIAFFFCPRIMNVPIHNVYNLYSSIDLSYDYYVVVSRLYKVEKKDLDDLYSTFKEFSRDDLRYFPCFNEEVFFCNCKIKQNTELKNTQSRIYVVSKDEFKLFLSYFAKELGGD